jgi:hypothetical protein
MSVSLLTLGYIAQIALYGAAGTQFIRAHLESRRMLRTRDDLPPSQRWRLYRFPHLAMRRSPAQSASERRMQVMMLSGFLFLLLAFILAIALRWIARGG